MAIPKKKSRIIKIDDVQYRWVVGPNDGYNVFIAEKEDVQGQKITAYFDTYLDKTSSSPNSKLKILKPKDAEFIIRQALKLGWDPDLKGIPIIFDWKENELFKRI